VRKQPFRSHSRERSEKMALLKGHCKENYEKRAFFLGVTGEREKVENRQRHAKM
jgi:hypothetical protein